MLHEHNDKFLAADFHSIWSYYNTSSKAFYQKHGKPSCTVLNFLSFPPKYQCLESTSMKYSLLFVWTISYTSLFASWYKSLILEFPICIMWNIILNSKIPIDLFQAKYRSFKKLMERLMVMLTSSSLKFIFNLKKVMGIV